MAEKNSAGRRRMQSVANRRTAAARMADMDTRMAGGRPKPRAAAPENSNPRYGAVKRARAKATAARNAGSAADRQRAPRRNFGNAASSGNYSSASGGAARKAAGAAADGRARSGGAARKKAAAKRAAARKQTAPRSTRPALGRTEVVRRGR